MSLISICIPTRNRGDILNRTLASIVSQPEFTAEDDFEIVISDNCSDDNTGDVVGGYVKKFPNKIRAFRTDNNIGFGNLLQALELGSGRFLKLNNDTLIHHQGSLAALRAAVCSAQHHEVIFFPNHISTMKSDLARYDNLDAFVKAVSYWVTWSSAFGIWKSDLETTRRLFVEKRSSEMPHAYVLLDMIARGRHVLVDNRAWFDAITPAKKGGYNIAQVFGSFYTGFLFEFEQRGALMKQTVELEKLRLFKFICSWYFDRSPQYVFEKTGFWKFLLPVYRNNFYIWPIAAFYWLGKGIKSVLKL